MRLRTHDAITARAAQGPRPRFTAWGSISHVVPILPAGTPPGTRTPTVQLSAGATGFEAVAPGAAGRSDFEFGLFEQLGHAPEERVGGDAVDDAMVVRERHVHDGVDRHVVLAVDVDDDDALLDLAHAQDPDVRLVDDRAAEEVPLEPRVRDAERRAAEIVDRDLAGAGPLREVVDRPHDPADPQLV